MEPEMDNKARSYRCWVNDVDGRRSKRTELFMFFSLVHPEMTLEEKTRRVEEIVRDD